MSAAAPPPYTGAWIDRPSNRWLYTLPDLQAFVLVSVIVLTTNLGGAAAWDLIIGFWGRGQRRARTSSPGDAAAAGAHSAENNLRPDLGGIFLRRDSAFAAFWHLGFWLVVNPLLRCCCSRKRKGMDEKWRHSSPGSSGVYKPLQSSALLAVASLLAWGTVALSIVMSFVLTFATEKTPLVLSANKVPEMCVCVGWVERIPWLRQSRNCAFVGTGFLTAGVLHSISVQYPT